MGSTCAQCFKAWQARLEYEPEYWLVRCISSGLVWRNAATRNWLGVTEPTDRWDNSIRWAHTQDVPAIESAFSLSLKTLCTASVSCRIKVQPHRYTLVDCHISPYRCHNCPLGCALLIYLVVPDPDVDSA
jgi:hypothetical protein